MIPELFFLRKGLALRSTDYASRFEFRQKNNLLAPNWFEIAMGVILFGTVVVNCYYKYHSETMVFMLNPCHVVSYIYCVICFAKFNRFTEFMFVWSIALNFGG